MKFTVSRTNGRVDVKIKGALDLSQADSLESEFQRLLQRDFKEAVFNFKSVPFITSSGIGKFLIFYKQASADGRQVRIKGINENLLNLFKIIKLDHLVPMEQ